MEKIEEAARQIDTLVSGLQKPSGDSNADGDKNGISLLALKNNFMLDYLHSMALLTLATLSASSDDDSDSKKNIIVERLVFLRVALEKIRPLEKKLAYQIDKVLQKANEADRREENRRVNSTKVKKQKKDQLDDDEGENDDNDDSDDADDVAKDPLSFKPNLASMRVRRDQTSNDNDDDEESSDGEVDSETKINRKEKSAVYKPPRIAPVPYQPETKNKKNDKKKDRHDKKLEGVFEEMATDIAGNNSAPYAETSTGLSVSAAARKRDHRQIDEIRRFEEDNMTRMFMSKKDAKRRREAEEDALFGRRGGPRARAGFDAELGDVLGMIGRKDNVYGRVKRSRH